MISATGIPVYVDENLDSVVAGGVEIRGIKGYIIPRRKLQKEPQLLVYKFTPYFITSAVSVLSFRFLPSRQFKICGHDYTNTYNYVGMV